MDIEPEVPRPQAGQSLPVDPIIPRPIRVVIADNHHAIRLGVRALLANKSNVSIVGETGNGQDALQLIQEYQPDIAIIDLALPELNGLDLTRSLRRLCLHTQVLIYTICDQDEAVAEALGAGVRGFLLKGEPEDQLIAAVEALAVGRSYFSPTISDVILDRLIDVEWQTRRDLLTFREREVIQLIAEGHANKVIAFQLGVTVKTVETHRMSAMRKLRTRNTADLVRWAIRNHIVEP